MTGKLMKKTIAIVEDEIPLFENYCEALNKHGYEVKGYHDKASAQQAFSQTLPDLVILDVGLGEEAEGGFDLCRELRAQSKSLPIIFLTALDSDFDTISGLRLGADDYLTKDTSLPHLLARISALFRRVSASSEPTPLQSAHHVGDLFIDAQRLLVTWKEQAVDLTLTEFWMVHALSKMPGHVKSRDQLMRDANTYIDENTITSHIKRIRKKFQKVDADFSAIESVYGLGYRWSG